MAMTVGPIALIVFVVTAMASLVASEEATGRLDMVGRAKYDAWSKTEGLSADEAKQRYIDYVASLRS